MLEEKGGTRNQHLSFCYHVGINLSSKQQVLGISLPLL